MSSSLIWKARYLQIPSMLQKAIPSALQCFEAQKPFYRCGGAQRQMCGASAPWYGGSLACGVSDGKANLSSKMISLLYGGGFYNHQCFGPFPLTYGEIADEARLEVLTWIMENTRPESMRPFRNTTNREISEEDKQFVLRIMKLDPRDRPSVQELLLDKWFQNAQFIIAICPTSPADQQSAIDVKRQRGPSK